MLHFFFSLVGLHMCWLMSWSYDLVEISLSPHHASLEPLAGPSCRDSEAQAQATEAAAEAERNESAAAQGLSAQLQAESDRRAKAFKTAVRAGVAKVQAELEAERDALEARYARSACVPTSTQGRYALSGAASFTAAMEDTIGTIAWQNMSARETSHTSRWKDILCATRIQELQHALAEAQRETVQALEGRREALAEAGARLADAEAAGELAVSAQEAADAARARERAALQSASQADDRIQAANQCALCTSCLP